ncbi:MAG: universal stress protein, partial [Lewinella sp.]
ERLQVFSQLHVSPVLATFPGRTEEVPVVRTTVREGRAAQTILWQSALDDIALVVLGGVGAGAGKQAPGLFGGVARTLALQGACPVILIPRDYGFTRVERLALAFAAIDDISRMSAITRRIITALRPQVHFVHVRREDAEGKGAEAAVRREEAFRQLSRVPGVPESSYCFDALPAGKVTETLIHYTKQHRIDLLVLGGQRRTFFERLFETGHLRPLINRCGVPLLIIPFHLEEL